MYNMRIYINASAFSVYTLGKIPKLNTASTCIYDICIHQFSLDYQEVPNDFDIKTHVLNILDESEKSILRPKNLDVDGFLR